MLKHGKVKKILACKNSNCIIDDHFSQVGKMIELAKGAKRKIDDYKLASSTIMMVVKNITIML